MSELKNLQKKFMEDRPADWEAIPDIDLYMDQVISYMTRQHIGLDLDDEENLTSAMINNYIKSGLLPRAKGKKYDRTHIGYLTAICLLKQVLSVGETGTLLEAEMEHGPIEDFYRRYQGVLDQEYSRVAADLDAEDRETKAALALRLAVSSYAQKLACKKLLQELTAEKEAQDGE